MGSLSFEHQYTIGGYLTFTLSVISGEFSGSSKFCISEALLDEAIAALSEMHKTLKGAYRMNDYDSDDFLDFKFHNLGHISVSGQVGGSHHQQYLKYQFMADQAILGGIITDLKHMRG